MESVIQRRVLQAQPNVLFVAEAMSTAEEESEALHRQLLDREIDHGSFIQKYKKLRCTYHRRALTHLAAKTSLNG